MTESLATPATSRTWDDVAQGDALATLHFPITVYRLIMAAGANRDFNAIHHNSEFAKRSGAPEMYANNLFLQGMWERSVRDYIGPAGVIRRLRGFRMKIFNTVGDSVTVTGFVVRKWLKDDVGDAGDVGHVEFEIQSANSQGVSVGPGRIVATLPRRRPAPG